MVYRVLGLMSGSSLDGLDIAYVEFQEQAGQWNYQIKETACYEYDEVWKTRLQQATTLPALDYQQLHVDFGHYIGQRVNEFINDKSLQYLVSLVASHGHTSFHIPAKKITAQLGDGAAIAAETKLPVVTDLRSVDIALGGQGAPIVPIGEKLLMTGYDYFLNIGGIANLSVNSEPYIAFDICPANRVLNMLANEAGMDFDKDGEMASKGSGDKKLLEELNALAYYKKPYPKSLANDFGTDTIYPLIKKAGLSINDALRTYSEHISIQIKNAVTSVHDCRLPTADCRLLITGGGAFNKFLIQHLGEELKKLQIEVVVPDMNLVSYKEAMIMAFIGVLRWRQESNVLASVTGASADSVGGALWS